MARRKVGGIEVDLLANTKKFETQVKEATDAASENDVEIGVEVNEAELEDAVERIRRKARETDAAASVGLRLDNADINSTLDKLQLEIDAMDFDAAVGLELAASAEAILRAEVEIAVAELRPEVLVRLALDVPDVLETLFDLAVLVEAAQSQVHIGAQLDVIDVEEAIGGVGELVAAANALPPAPAIAIGASVDNTDVEDAIVGVSLQVAAANATPGGPSIGIGAHVNNASVIAAVNAAGAQAAIAAAGTPGGGGGGAGGGGGPFAQAGQAAGNSFLSGFEDIAGGQVLAGLIAAFAGPLITGIEGLAGSITALFGSAFTAVSAGAIALIPIGFTLGISFGAAAIGFQGVAGALKALWQQDPEALAKALGKLSPSAAAFITAIADAGIIDAFKDIQGQVQENLFKNLDDQVQRLADTTIPQIGDALGLGASDVNQFFVEVANIIAGHDFRTMFANLQPANVAIFGGLSTTLDTLLDVVTQATPLANDLGGSFEGIANHINDIVNSQDFLDFLETGRASLEAWGHFLSPLLGSLVQLFEIGAQPANTFLTEIGDATKGFEDFTHSAEGQNAISKFFTKSFVVLKGFGPILKGLGKGLGNLFDDRSIKTFLTAAQGLGKALPTIFGAIDIAAAFFAPIVDAIGDLFQAFEPLLPLLEQLAPILGDLVAGGIRMLAGQIKSIIPVIEFLIEGVIGIATAVQFVAHIFEGVIQAGFRAFGAAMEFVVEKVTQFADFLIANVGPALSQIIPGAVHAAQAALGFLSTAWDGVKAAAEAVWNWFTGTLIPFLKTGFDAAVSAAKTVIGGLATAWDAIKTAAGAAWDWLSGTLFPRLGPDGLLGTVMATAAAVLGFFSDAWDKIKTAAGAAWDWLSGTLFPRLGPDGLLGTAMATAAAVLGFFSDAWDKIKSAAVAVWDWLSGTLFPRLGADGLMGQAMRAAALVLGLFSGAWDAIKTAAGAVWDWLNRVIFAGFDTGGVMDTIFSTAATIIGRVTGAFETLKTTAGNVWDFIVSAGEDALAGIVTVVNGIIGALNFVISGVNLVPGVNIPKIPTIHLNADATVDVDDVTVTPAAQATVVQSVQTQINGTPVPVSPQLQLAKIGMAAASLPLIGDHIAGQIREAIANSLDTTTGPQFDPNETVTDDMGAGMAKGVRDSFEENFAPFMRRAKIEKVGAAIADLIGRDVRKSDYADASKRVVGAIGTGIEDSAADVQSSVKLVTASAVIALTLAIPTFQNAGLQLMVGLNQGITIGTIPVILSFATLGARAVAALGPVGTVLQPSGFQMMVGLAAGITVGTILVAVAVARAAAAISGQAGSFVSAGNALMDGLLRGISSGTSQVTGFIRLVPLLLVLALGDLSRTYYSQGQQLAQGLIDGFRAQMSTFVPSVPGVGGTNGTGALFAAGGIVSGPTLALIGEGRGREAVIPLDAPLSTVDSSVRPLAELIRGQRAGLTVNQTIVTQTEDNVSVATQVVNRMAALVNR